MRTTSTVDAILETVPNKSLNYLKPLCGLPISPYFSALKFRWLIENVPKVRQAVDEKRCCVGTVDTWLIWVIMLLILQSINNGLIVSTKL
jgi:glycerol kinase